MKYDKIIMLIYMKTYKDTYSFEYIKEYFDFSYTELDNFINNMIKDNMLEYNEDFILTITKNAEKFLESLNLQDVAFDELMIDYQEKMVDEIKSEVRLGINDIYIPRYFNVKFDGYRK